MAKKRNKSKNWIQKAIKRPGALRKWLRKHAKQIEKVTDEKPFTKSGKINIRCLKKLRHTSYYERLSKRRKEEINLAITLSKLRKR